MADWDDEPASGFGGGFGRGKSSFGRGSGGFGSSEGGGGFGRARGKKIDSENFGGGGFGGRGKSGFGATNGTMNGEDSSSGFVSKGGRGGGFGSSNNFSSNGDGDGSSGGFGGGRSRGGFGKPSGGDDWDNDNNADSKGSSGGFGSRRTGGFGGGGGFGNKDDDEDAPRGGGFGSKPRFGGFGGDSDKKGGGCYHCGGDGHFARECPDKPGGGGGGGRGCHKCGEEGHFARECPTGGGGGGGGGSRACHKCGEEGHFARECPTGGGGGGGGGRACHKCGEEGHFARECPTGGGGGGGGSGCRKCGEDGHFARECPQNLDEDGKPKEPPYVPPPPPEGEEELFQTMEIGINFQKYDHIPVEVTGSDKPAKGIDCFDEADLSETLRSNVRKAKYDKPTPIQKWAIPVILKGRDLMGCAQTGSGKTAAFLLPVLTGMIRDGVEGAGSYAESQTPNAIIVGPTRELVIQIWKDALKFSHGTILRPVVVYGGTSVGHQLRQLENGAHMVVGTPGRLLDFINRGKISLSKVRYLILDEADRMLDMGFEPEIRKLVEQLGMPGKSDRQTLMFSATFPDDIQKLALDFLNDYIFVTVGRVGAANTDITQSVFEVTQFDKREKLVAILNESGTDRTLVFVEQKRNADFLASFLSQSQFPTTSIHGDRLQKEREEALSDFKSGRAPILVATSVAARGLDIPGVKHVVNFDMPSAIEEYVHRIGRTGRCGNTGRATSFFDTDRDKDMARSLVKVLSDAHQDVPAWLEEAAEGAFGQGFGEVGGKFGGRDTRRGKFGGGGGGGGSSGFGGESGGFGGGGGGGFSSGGGGAADDEDWD